MKTLFSFFIFFSISLLHQESKKNQRNLASSESDHKVIFLLLDGVNETIFKDLLDKGSLPHFSQMLENKDPNGYKGIYTPATSVWPSTTGPGYAPFIMGLYPQKSNLTGIRLFNRETKKYRIFAGSDLLKINNEVSKEFPTIYEVFEKDQTFSQTGFIFRRGWKADGSYIKPHASITSITALCEKLKLDDAESKIYKTDYKTINSFLSKTSGKKRFQGAAERSFFNVKKRLGKKMNPLHVGFHLMASSFEKIIFRGRKSLNQLPKFSFMSLHAPDSIAHKYGVGEKYKNAIIELDFMVGWIREYLEMIGEHNVSLIISSDHGVDPVENVIKHHHRLVDQISESLSLKIRDSEKRFSNKFNRKMKKELIDHDGFSSISGNANMQLYLKNDPQWKKKLSDLPSFKGMRYSQFFLPLIKKITKLQSTENVYFQINPSQYMILNQEGVSQITMNSDKTKASYQVLEGKDPLFHQSKDQELLKAIKNKQTLSLEQWAIITKDSNYPDSIQQIVQLLDSKRGGDIFIDAKVGYEPWDEMQAGVHGALRKDHIRVPLLISSKILDEQKARQFFKDLKRFPRTVDVYPTILKALDTPIPSSISFKRDKKTVTIPVRTDIDGVSLDIWK